MRTIVCRTEFGFDYEHLWVLRFFWTLKLMFVSCGPGLIIFCFWLNYLFKKKTTHTFLFLKHFLKCFFFLFEFVCFKQVLTWSPSVCCHLKATSCVLLLEFSPTVRTENSDWWTESCTSCPSPLQLIKALVCLRHVKWQKSCSNLLLLYITEEKQTN